MFLQAIDRDAAAPVTGCPIQRNLAELAAGLDTRFLRAGATLATAVETIDQVIRGLDGVVAALDQRTAGIAVADMQHVARQLSELPLQQADRVRQMNDVSALSRKLSEDVLDMNQALRLLNIYGMNIKIAAAGEEQFVGFVERMAGKLGFGEQHLDGFIQRLKVLTNAVATVRQADRLLAAESAKVIPQVPERLAGDAAALSQHLTEVTRLANEVAAIARSVQGKVAVVLGALQVGDSTRQRLEHIVSALQIVETRNGEGDAAVSGHVDRLLAAQLRATVADFTRETSAMLSSLADLSPDTARLLTLIGEQGSGGGGRALLLRVDQGIADVERVTTRLREAENRSRTMTGIIADTVGELSSGLASVQQIRIDVQDIATNTRLLCRRHGAIGKAVSVIAAEVDARTVRLGKAAVSVAGAIAALDRIQASLRNPEHGDGRDMGETLSAALGVIRRACQRTEEVIEEGGDNARQLVELLDSADQELSQELAVGEVMSAAAGQLDGRTAPAELTEEGAAVLRDILPAIGALYTMAAEREVHRDFLLPGMAEEVPAPPAVEDDDDDGLF